MAPYPAARNWRGLTPAYKVTSAQALELVILKGPVSDTERPSCLPPSTREADLRPPALDLPPTPSQPLASLLPALLPWALHLAALSKPGVLGNLSVPPSRCLQAPDTGLSILRGTIHDGRERGGKRTLPVQESQARGGAGLHGAPRGPPTAWGRQADCTTGRTCPRHQRGGREGPSPRTSGLEQRAPSPVCSGPHGPPGGFTM